MRILLDGQRLPVDVKLSKDLLLTLRTIAQAQNWRIHYDAPKGIVYLNTDSRSPIIDAERKNITSADMESTRLIGKTICIDPGHGGKDPGAIGPTGTYEKDHTLAISLLLRDKLERNGSKVIMTREIDQSVALESASAENELAARVSVATQAKADLFISIHNDGFISPTTNGVSTYHHGNPESSRLAAAIQQCLVESLEVRDRGSQFASFYVIRHTPMPSVLAEIAFISNPDEEMMLASEDGRKKAATGLFEGIVSYYKL